MCVCIYVHVYRTYSMLMKSSFSIFENHPLPFSSEFIAHFITFYGGNYNIKYISIWEK